jgi:hypothetical protein
MFHSSNPSLFGRPASVLCGANALQSTVFELRGACASLSSNAPHAFLSTFRLLSDFAGQLSGYFEATGSADHFDAISEECPNLGPRARVVQQGHEELRVSVAAAKSLGRGPDTICTLGFSRHVGRLLDDFEEHEHAERRLLQDFFLSAGDAAS